ncbi:MAG: hypothetical protein AAGF99_14650, partial [Bacteroidota bacterium]
MAPFLPTARRRALPVRPFSVRPFSVRPFAGARQVAQRRLGWLRRSTAAGTLTLAMLQGAPEAQAQVASFPAGAEFQVNTNTTNDQEIPSIAMDADGDFVIAWESDGQDGDGEGIYAQRYAADGTALGSEFQVNTYTTGRQIRPAVAMDADADLVIPCRSRGQDGEGEGVYAQRYDPTGLAQ